MHNNFPYFSKPYYTRKQNFHFWFLYYFRAWVDLFSGIIGILTFGFISIWWGADVSEKILRLQMKYYHERKQNEQIR